MGTGEQLWLLQRHQVANSQHTLREQAASAGFILHSGRESTLKARLVFFKRDAVCDLPSCKSREMQAEPLLLADAETSSPGLQQGSSKSASSRRGVRERD